MKTRLLLTIGSCVARALRRSFRPLFRAALLVTLLVFLPDLMQSAAPPAGTSIGNQASATYTDSSNTPRTATSNVAITIVQQVASFTLTASASKFAAPGGQVVYPHTLVNTGNGIDTFNLSVVNAVGDDFDLNSVALYADVNGDGLPDNATAITSSGALAAGVPFKFVALGIVPGAAAGGQVGTLTVTASGTATASPAAAASNTDTTTVTTSNAVVNVTKSLSSNRGAAGSGPHTVTLTYQNVGNNTATNLTLRDVIPAGMTYSNTSARWSVTGGTTLTDADNTDPQGTSPDTIIYDYNVTVAGRVTAVISRVVPGQSGTLTFQVYIDSGQAGGDIDNTATYVYDPGTGTPIGPYNANTATFTVTTDTGVALTLTGATVASASQGGIVIFTNVLVNTGNTLDTFDITVTNSTFPAGSTFTLYQSDGNTPLVDSTGNGVPDTGPLAASQSYNVVLKLVLPTGTSAGGPYTAQKTARSKNDPTVSASANDVLTTISASTVDLSNGGSGGAGVGPEASAVVVNTVNPGVTTRFTLYVTNTSSVADFYNLTASTDSTFASLTLPTGWNVVFRDASEAIVTSSGVLNAGSNKTLYADVSISSTNAPGTNHVYFRVLSPTSGATDRLHDAVSVNTVRSITVAPNNNGQISAASSVIYSHLIQNNGNVLEGDGTASSIALSVANSQAGWSAVVYFDGNGNGVVDGSDTVVTNLSFTSAGGAGLAPGESARLLVKVFAPPGVAIGTINVTTLSATTANGTYTTTVPVVATATDNTTVISGDLTLLKEQALDADLNGSPDTAYATTDITTGALPGKSIRYRITVTNQGSAPATSVKIFDSTPAYTVYTTTGPAATSVGSIITVPADNTAGPLAFNIGTLNPGQSAVVTFGVIISP